MRRLVDLSRFQLLSFSSAAVQNRLLSERFSKPLVVSLLCLLSIPVFIFQVSFGRPSSSFQRVPGWGACSSQVEQDLGWGPSPVPSLLASGISAGRPQGLVQACKSEPVECKEPQEGVLGQRLSFLFEPENKFQAATVLPLCVA